MTECALIRDYCRRNLPERVAEHAGTILHQTGEMRLKPEGPWVEFSAEQSIHARRTQFVWHARIKLAPLVTSVVEDAFEAGQGRLDAKVWGVLPVAHGRGVEVDRGEAQRYLAELAWCPAAMLHNAELQFEQRDARTVRVWVGDPQTYVDLSFDAGDLVQAHTNTRTRGDMQATQPWYGRFWEYVDFGGLRAPRRAEVWWETPEGRFVYWKGQVTSLEFHHGE